jgi:hypothetical protein
MRCSPEQLTQADQAAPPGRPYAEGSRVARQSPSSGCGAGPSRPRAVRSMCASGPLAARMPVGASIARHAGRVDGRATGYSSAHAVFAATVAPIKRRSTLRTHNSYPLRAMPRTIPPSCRCRCLSVAGPTSRRLSLSTTSASDGCYRHAAASRRNYCRTRSTHLGEPIRSRTARPITPNRRGIDRRATLGPRLVDSAAGDPRRRVRLPST